MANRLEISYKKPGSNSNDIIVEENIDGDAAVSYDGNNIATVSAGETKTIQCSDKFMRTNVVVADKVLNCAGKKMNSDIIVKVGFSELEQYTLTIYKGTASSVTVNGTSAESGDIFNFEGGANVKIFASCASDLWAIENITVTGNDYEKIYEPDKVITNQLTSTCTAEFVIDKDMVARINTSSYGTA